MITRNFKAIKPHSVNTPLIFLDVDGVLNTHDFDYTSKSNSIHRDKIQHVNTLIDGHDARIVLSSAWRYLVIRGEMNLVGLNWLFRSHGLKMIKHHPFGSIVGITDDDYIQDFDDNGNPMFREDDRARQVMRYREKNEHTGKYVIIDDNDLGFTQNNLPFVQTSTSVGLTVELAVQASLFLQEEING